MAVGGPASPCASNTKPHPHYTEGQTNQQCGICQTGQTITNPVNLSCCGNTFCAGCICGLLTTHNIYGCGPRCPTCTKDITPTPQLDEVVQKFRQLQLQSKLDGVNSNHIDTVLSSCSSSRPSVEGVTKPLRRSPRSCRENPIKYPGKNDLTHRLPNITSVLLSHVGKHFTRSDSYSVNVEVDIPLKVVLNDLLPKFEEMPKTKKRLDLLYHMVRWRVIDLPPAKERLNNKERVLMKNVPGYGSRIKRYNDYPTSLDAFTNEFWHTGWRIILNTNSSVK